MVAMGLSNFHKKQQLETDLKILDWMEDFSINEPEFKIDELNNILDTIVLD